MTRGETRLPEVSCLASKPSDLRVGDGAGEASPRVRWRSWRVFLASFSFRAVTAAAYATLNGRLSVSGMPCFRRVALEAADGILERKIRDKFWEIWLTFDSWSLASEGNDGRRYERGRQRGET